MNRQTKEKVQPKKKKLALGRGLEALIPVESTPQEEYFQCDLDAIHPNPYQPRSQYSETELAELARSIEQQGVLQPLLVRKDADGYALIAGERRLRAARMAGLRQVPVVVKDVSDTDSLQMSIIENIQRENLNPLEEAEAYHRLMTEFRLTQEEVSTRVGKSRSAVANFLRLRQLSEPIKTSILEGALSMGHARALLGAENTAQQHAAWQTILSKGLSVRQTEALVKRLRSKGGGTRNRVDGSENRYFSELADELSRRLGTRVRIRRKGKRGSVHIEFYSDADLERLIELFERIR